MWKWSLHLTTACPMSKQATPTARSPKSLSPVPVDQRTLTDNQANPNVKTNRVPLPNEVLALRSLVNVETAVVDTIRASLAKARETTLAAEKRVAEARLELEAALSSLSASRDSVHTLERLLPSIVE